MSKDRTRTCCEYLRNDGQMDAVNSYNILYIYSSNSPACITCLYHLKKFSWSLYASFLKVTWKYMKSLRDYFPNICSSTWRMVYFLYIVYPLSLSLSLYYVLPFLLFLWCWENQTRQLPRLPDVISLNQHSIFYIGTGKKKMLAMWDSVKECWPS